MCRDKRGIGATITYDGDVLNQIPSNIPHHIVQVVVVHVAVWLPETDVSVASRILGIWLEFVDFSMGELREKPWVFRPEQPDIGDGIENHSDTLESQTESPAHFV